jgi:hypothetical protein
MEVIHGVGLTGGSSDYCCKQAISQGIVRNGISGRDANNLLQALANASV